MAPLFINRHYQKWHSRHKSGLWEDPSGGGAEKNPWRDYPPGNLHRLRRRLRIGAVASFEHIIQKRQAFFDDFILILGISNWTSLYMLLHRVGFWMKTLTMEITLDVTLRLWFSGRRREMPIEYAPVIP